MLKAKVPWNGSVPAPGASNVMKHVSRSLALAERPSPSMARLRQTASAQGKRSIDFLECRVVIFFVFIFLLRLDCGRLLQREKIRTVSEKMKFLFSARRVRLVFCVEQAEADRAITSTRSGWLRRVRAMIFWGAQAASL